MVVAFPGMRQHSLLGNHCGVKLRQLLLVGFLLLLAVSSYWGQLQPAAPLTTTSRPEGADAALSGRQSTLGAGPAAAATGIAAKTTASAAATASQPPKKLAPIPKKELPPKCMHLESVCFDQQQVVLMDPIYGLKHPEQEPLPDEPRTEQQWTFPSDASMNSDVWGGISELPPLIIRQAGVREATVDLRQPQFDTGVLPLVFKPLWHDNFGHTLANSVTWLYEYLHARNVSWADRVALVVQTPYGMALPSHWPKLAGPLVPAHPLQTLADFSARYKLPGSASGEDAVVSRCYAQALICPGLEEGGTHAINITQAAAFLVRHYTATPFAANVTYEGGGDECSSSSSMGSTSSDNGGSRRCLRVLFISRNAKPAVRQLLNLQELVQQCREWQYEDTSTGIRFTAACAAYRPTGDLQQDIAVVRTADVMVGTHGAANANGFFLRPGAAMFEIFMRGWSWHLHRGWLDEDAASQIQWWGITVEDPGLLSPGEVELKYKGHPNLYSGWWGDHLRLRDFNVRMPWAGLSRLLQHYARTQLAGGYDAYRRRRKAKKHPVHYLLKPGGVLEADLVGPVQFPL